MKDYAKSERRQVIAITEPQSEIEMQALATAAFESQRADALESALRESALSLHMGDVTGALKTINNALRL